jgi:hypothetical protein
MNGWRLATCIFFATTVGLTIRVVRQSDELDKVQQLRDENASMKLRVQEAVASLGVPAAKRRARDDREHPPGEVPAGTRIPVDVATETPAKSTPAVIPPEVRAKRVADLVREMHAWFENHEGEKALAALKELAALVPEGRDAAMKLALEINADVEGAGELRLPQQQFYTGLGDPAIVGLMTWALENEASSPADFRVLSVWSLPWIVASPDETIARFDAALSHENDRGVQGAIVSNLGQINSPKAESVLSRVLTDAARDATLRADAAMALATSRDPAVQRAIDAAAAVDPSPRMQTAARVSQVVRNPPATGCLITYATPDGMADTAGMRPGDVIVSYNGRAVPTEADLRKETKATTGTDEVAVVIVRDGAQQTLQVKAGRLDRGVALKPVAKK